MKDHYRFISLILSLVTVKALDRIHNFPKYIFTKKTTRHDMDKIQQKPKDPYQKNLLIPTLTKKQTENILLVHIMP